MLSPRTEDPTEAGPTRTGRGDRGNIAIAMSVLLVLSGLAMAGLARTLSVMKAARSTQAFAANLSWADSAVSDVLWRLDQVDQGAAGTHVLTRTTTEYTYTATPNQSYFPPDSYTILAKGKVGTDPHGVKATVYRRRQFGYGLYTVSDLNLAGGSPATIHGHTESDGTYTPAIIGSSGTITLPASRTSPGGGDGQDYFFPSGACINCYTTSTYRTPDAQHLAATDAPITDPVTMPSGTTQTCNFSGAITDGTYRCAGDLSFTGTTSVSQTGTGVTIYVPAGKSLYLNQNKINYNSTCTTAGNSSLLKIFMVGGSGSIIDIGSSGTACLSAIVYAPASNFTPQGQGMTFTGSMFLYSATGNGDPTGFNFYYDRNAASVTRDWKLQNYQEIPSSQVP
jgi:hypothetical protein